MLLKIHFTKPTKLLCIEKQISTAVSCQHFGTSALPLELAYTIPNTWPSALELQIQSQQEFLFFSGKGIHRNENCKER